MNVSVDQLSLKVASKDRAGKQLLQDITFTAEPGDVIALMGP
eukprot:CAMPEP_0115074060 /NCGR_PEP_ID=MMETSP0227-20121206/15137_1 /TAXON_ID=89957 /ORGANISM="Polarella glacialis, Strain CCMP 1383" /LENGTH=41 /DNA_ID= /DNA_START= /DNA_END= /DNA_ORIENTATION=